MTDVMVPALGESVSEATVSTWFKKPGDAVAVDGVAEVVGGREAADHEDVGPELVGQIVGDHLEEHPGVEAVRHGRPSCAAASARSRRPAR